MAEENTPVGGFSSVPANSNFCSNQTPTPPALQLDNRPLGYRITLEGAKNNSEIA